MSLTCGLLNSYQWKAARGARVIFWTLRLGNRLIEASAANTNGGRGRIRKRERLGGLLNYYYREAA